MTVNDLLEIVQVVNKMIQQTDENKTPANVSYRIYRLSEEINNALVVPNNLINKAKENNHFGQSDFNEEALIQELQGIAEIEIDLTVRKIRFEILEHFFLSVAEINRLTPIIEE